jgi:uncharacterized protein YfaS (alpha-2-macroglobulin family)
VQVQREYFAADAPGRPLPEVHAEERFLERLTVTLNADLDYLVLEDPRPAGCEIPVDAFNGVNASWTEKEERDDRTNFFFSHLKRGTYTIEYRLRAETPGDYHVMPAVFSNMYVPGLRGSSAESRLRILPKGRET